MEVERFPIVVRDGQEVAFLTLGAGVGIVLHFVQPLLACRRQVAAQHVGNGEFIGHGEHGRRRRLRGDDLPQFFGQGRADVLPSALVVLRSLGAATDIRLVASQEHIGLGETPQLIGSQAGLDGRAVQRDTFKRVHLVTRAARQRRRADVGPFRRRQHAPPALAIGFDARALDATQGIVRQLRMIRQPLRESLARDNAPLDRSGRVPLGLHGGHVSIHAVGRDIARLLESRRRADFPDEQEGAFDVAFAALSGLHHRFEVGQVQFDRLARLGDDRLLPGVDNAVTTKSNVSQLVGEDALRRRLVRGERALFTTLAVVVVPRNIPRAAVLPFEDAAFAVAAIAFLGHDSILSKTLVSIYARSSSRRQAPSSGVFSSFDTDFSNASFASFNVRWQ